MSGRDESEGRIPVRLRIGVTGHRQLDNIDALRERISEVLERIAVRLPLSASLPIRFAVVSPLAEGADRLVADTILNQVDHTTLEVPLPLPLEEYLKDFETPGSRKEFDRLRQRAVLEIEAPASNTREEAYERVGHFVVDRCDVLIALWDGEEPRGRGGTAYIVDRARKREMPVYWIDTQADFSISEENTDGIAAAVLAEADHYNAAPIRGYERALASERAYLLPANRTESTDLRLDEFADWILPYFVRADRLALREQHRYHRGTWLLFSAAALAVSSAAASAAFPSAFERVEYLPGVAEVAFLLAVVVIYVTGTRRRIHERWIWYRFLAERFRSAFFLALAGLGQRSAGGFNIISTEEDAQEWAQRAFAEVWDRRPPGRLPADVTPELRAFLAQSWLGNDDPGRASGQIGYHRARSHACETRDARLKTIVKCLLGLTIVAALVHIGVGSGDPNSLTVSHIALFLSLSLPACGAAIAGITSDREYHRHGARYARMANALTEIRSELETADRPEDIRACTDKAEQTMLEEHRGWFGVQQFHGFEPQV